METSHIPLKNEEVILVDEFEDFTVLFNTLTAETMGLNPPAVMIWNEINGEKLISQIIDDLADHFPESRARFIADTEELFRNLYRRMFIRFSDEPPALENQRRITWAR